MYSLHILFRHLIFIDNFDVTTEIEVQNLDASTFNTSKPIWKQIFSKIFKVPKEIIELRFEKMIKLRYNKGIGRIMIEIKSITPAKKEFVVKKIESQNFITAIEREKDEHRQLQEIAIPKQELIPIIKPVSGKFKV